MGQLFGAHAMSTLDKAQAEDAAKRLGQATVAAVRASNGLPEGRDYVLHKSSCKEFQARVAGPKGSGKAEKRVLMLLDRILSHGQREPSGFARKKGVEPDDVFEAVVDFADARLEAVDFLMDEMAGRAPTVQAGVVGAAAYGGGTGKGGKFSALIRGKPEDLGLAKPQLRFKDPVDNSNDSPFVPKAWPKVHAASDERASAASGAHPYAAEMAALEYTAHQLATPADIQEPRPMEETPFTFVDTPEGLQAMHSALLGCPEIAVDLEHHSLRSFQGLTCLMQVSTREQDFIVDTIAVREHMQVLLPAFTDPAITKVFHGADMDMRWLERDFGLYIVNLFDTGQAARVLQLPSFALSYLLERFCGQTPDKKFQLADWRVRPLSADMLKYARMDTHFLLYIYDKVRELLLERDSGGDRLLRSALSMSIQVAQLRYEKPVFAADSYLLVLKRSGRVMSPQQTAVFAAIFAWRDELARARDESCDFVLPTTMLFKLATSMPASRSAVLDACKPNVPPLVREQVEIVAKLCCTAAEPAHAAEPAPDDAPAVPKPDAGYALAGWVPEEEEAEEVSSRKRPRPEPKVELHASNRPGSRKALAQTASWGRKRVVLLPDGELRCADVRDAAAGMGSGVDAVGGVSAAALAKVARIRAAFTAEFPQVHFVPPEPEAAAVDDGAGGDAIGEDEEEKVEDMQGAGLEEDGKPRSIRQAFKGPGKTPKKKAAPAGGDEEGAGGGESGEEGDEADSDKKMKKRKAAGESASASAAGEEGAEWARALGWQDNLRAKLAAGDGSAGGGGGMEESPGGEFKPFDYHAATAGAA